MAKEAVRHHGLPSQGVLLAVPLALCAPRAPPLPHEADKAGRLGYQAKQSYVICQIPVCCGGCKHSVPKGLTYSKPVHHGTDHLTFAGSLQSIAKE